jgi:DNA-binding transcriptional LysR family regulator
VYAVELTDLHYLSATADAGKLTHAAKLLRIDVSTISRRIGALEDELGLSLFERDNSGIRLTAGGGAVLLLARRILSNIEEMRHVAEQIARGDNGAIRMGTRVAPIGGCAQALLRKWCRTNPNVAFSILEGSDCELSAALRERRLDAALVAGRTNWPHVATARLFRERIVAALPKGHHLTERPSLDWTSLSSERVLIQDGEGNGMLSQVHAKILDRATLFQAHAASRQALLALVGAGLGVTLVAESEAELTVPGIVFKPLEEPDSWLEFDLVWRPEIDDPLVGRFIAFMRDESRAGRPC